MDSLLNAEALRAMLLESRAVIAERDCQIAAMQAEHHALDLSHTRLRKTYERLKEELALLKRRLFVAKAERVDTAQLELEFEELAQKLDALAGQMTDTDPPADPPAGPKPKDGAKRGRRGPADLASLPKETVRITDPVMEDLVEDGQAKAIGVEATSQLGYLRGGFRHVVTERVKYVVLNKHGLPEMETAAIPAQLLRRCLATASTLAHIATNKFADGLPLYRQQERMARDGATIDRGTMSRWLEQLGGVLGATVVAAMDRDARDNAFCILTDATGFAIQPGRFDDPKQRKRRPCRKGHYFVRIADRDHVLFDFAARHTSKAVHGLFKGYQGYVQADASSVFDVLFRSLDEHRKGDPEHDGCTRIEVGCWAHARRKYWESAMSKSEVARAALFRISGIFKLDAKIRKRKPPPSEVIRLRNLHLRPLVEEFLEFAQAEYDETKAQRSSLQSALGYTVRQKDAMRAFLQDPRLRLDNNPSEGALRKVVRIRDAAFFAGSDEHAQSAGAILSLLASAKLHGLDPERYLREIIRLLPFWTPERYLELAPKYWVATRQTLNITQLEAEVGVIDVPAPTDGTAKQSSTNAG